MKQYLTTIIRSDIRALPLYEAIPSLWDENDQQVPGIKLDAGENPYGCSPAALRRLRAFDAYNIYPDSRYRTLRQAIATYTSMPANAILVGNGSDELLDLLLRAIIDNRDAVINCPPTFGMYAPLITLNRGRLISVPRTPSFAIDTQKVLRAINKKTKAIIICSPNNPTGNTTPLKDIQILLDTGKLVIVDEAYVEFSTQSVLPLIKYPNLVIVRTLSKWAGLAGLRVGYMIGNPGLIRQIEKIKSPYNVNVAAVVAARATLENPQAALRTVSRIISERRRMTEALKKITSFTVYPSQTNSLFIRVGRQFTLLQRIFRQKNIAVRYYPSNSLRLTIGTPQQNTAVLAALQLYEKT